MKGVHMDGYLVHGGMGMARGATARIEDGRGILVYVWEGELWITQEGDSRDHFVGPGGWFRVERDGAALLHALRETRATLTAPTAENYARRITLAPAVGAPARPIYQREKGVRNLLSLGNLVRFLEKRFSY